MRKLMLANRNPKVLSGNIGKKSARRNPMSPQIYVVLAELNIEEIRRMEAGLFGTF
jgi:hypothetical protein